MNLSRQWARTLWLLYSLGSVQSVAQMTTQGGIFLEGTSLVVKAKPNDNYNGRFSAGALTIRWNNNYSISLGAISSPFGFAKDEKEKIAGNYRYQKFGAVTIPADSINWISNQEYVLLRVPVNQAGSGVGRFELAPNGFAADWYVELNAVDHTNSAEPFYKALVRNVPLGSPARPASLNSSRARAVKKYR